MSSAPIRSLLHDRSGLAAIEFAVVGPLLIALLGVMVDMGLSQALENRLAQAVSAGAQYAFTVGATVTSGSIQSAVQNGTTLSGVTAAVTGPGLYCTTGSPATLSADPAGTTCADGTLPGTYVRIVASYTYTPLLPQVSTMVSTNLQQSATVRLQ